MFVYEDVRYLYIDWSGFLSLKVWAINRTFCSSCFRCHFSGKLASSRSVKKNSGRRSYKPNSRKRLRQYWQRKTNRMKHHVTPFYLNISKRSQRRYSLYQPPGNKWKSWPCNCTFVTLFELPHYMCLYQLVWIVSSSDNWYTAIKFGYTQALKLNSTKSRLNGLWQNIEINSLRHGGGTPGFHLIKVS